MELPAQALQIAPMKNFPHEPAIRIEAPPGVELRIEPLMFPVGTVPAIGASAVSLPPDLQSEPEQQGTVFQFQPTPDAESKGEQIIQMVRDAVRACQSGGTQPTPKAIRTLARLIEVRPELAYRVPQLHEYLAWLADKDLGRLTTRIVGDTRPGRPRERYLFLIALVDRIMKLEGCSAAKAADIAARRYATFLSMGAEAIRNRYSELRELYQAINGIQYASGNGLLPYWPPLR